MFACWLFLMVGAASVTAAFLPLIGCGAFFPSPVMVLGGGAGEVMTD